MQGETTVSNKVFPSANELKEMRRFDENPRTEPWVSHERHFFIITDSARPVYCRYGDEVNVTPLLCTMVAFTGQLVRDGNQLLQTLVAGDKLFVFYLPLPFIFACVSSINLPVDLITEELKYLERVIVSLLTHRISAQLRARPNFDIKRQTADQERLFTSMLELMDSAHTFIFHDCMPMAALSTKRPAFKRIAFEKRAEPVLAFVLLFKGEVFFTINSNQLSLTTEDIMVLINNTYPAMDSLDNSWAPIWLPSTEAMLHAMTVDAKQFELKMIMVATKLDASTDCSRMAEQIVKGMTDASLQRELAGIKQFQHPLVRHWVVANRKLKQVSSPYINGEFSKTAYREYAWAYDYCKRSNIDGTFYLADEFATLFGRHSGEVTRIVSMPAGVPAKAAHDAFNAFEEYFEKNENVFFDKDLDMVWE